MSRGPSRARRSRSRRASRRGDLGRSKPARPRLHRDPRPGGGASLTSGALDTHFRSPVGSPRAAAMLGAAPRRGPAKARDGSGKTPQGAPPCSVASSLSFSEFKCPRVARGAPRGGAAGRGPGGRASPPVAAAPPPRAVQLRDECVEAASSPRASRVTPGRTMGSNPDPWARLSLQALSPQAPGRAESGGRGAPGPSPCADLDPLLGGALGAAARAGLPCRGGAPAH